MVNVLQIKSAHTACLADLIWPRGRGPALRSGRGVPIAPYHSMIFCAATYRAE